MEEYNVFGVRYTVTNYDEASTLIVDKANNRISFGVSALAVHGLVTAYRNINLLESINKIDLIVPDGQPIKWALNSIYNLNMIDRVYGPTLTLHVLEKANILKHKIFLYGSTESTIMLFKKFINDRYPDINVCGIHIDRFREATKEEDKVNKQVFYVGDKPIEIVEWVNGFSRLQIGKNIRLVSPLFVKSLALFGDVLKNIGVAFPINSSRYKSMTTSNDAPMDKTFVVLGNPPYSLEEGIEATVDWLKVYHPKLIKI